MDGVILFTKTTIEWEELKASDLKRSRQEYFSISDVIYSSTYLGGL